MVTDFADWQSTAAPNAAVLLPTRLSPTLVARELLLETNPHAVCDLLAQLLSSPA